MSEELREQLARQIEDAFAETPYPGDDNLGWGCGGEGKAFEQALRGKHWKELTIDFIVQHRDEIECVTADGFRFYLPAFMLAVLLHWDEVDTLPLNLISALTPPKFKDSQRAFKLRPKLAQSYSLEEHNRTQMDNFQKKVKACSPMEKAAVKAFLDAYPSLFPQDRLQHERARQGAAVWRSKQS